MGTCELIISLIVTVTDDLIAWIALLAGESKIELRDYENCNYSHERRVRDHGLLRQMYDTAPVGYLGAI